MTLGTISFEMSVAFFTTFIGLIIVEHGGSKLKGAFVCVCAIAITVFSTLYLQAIGLLN